MYDVNTDSVDPSLLALTGNGSAPLVSPSPVVVPDTGPAPVDPAQAQASLASLQSPFASLTGYAPATADAGPVTSPDQVSPATPSPASPLAQLAGPVTSPQQAVQADDSGNRQSPKAFLQTLAANDQAAKDPIAQYQRQAQGALGEQKANALAQGDVAAAKAAEDYQTLAQRNKDLDAARADAEKVRQQRLAEEQKRQADIDKMVDQAATMKVDPNREWNSKSTADKIGTAIGAMFSGIGMAMAGKPGENPVLESIKEHVKMDVAAQTANIDQFNKSIGLKKDSLSSYHQMTQDVNQASQLKIAEGYKRAADQIEATAAKFGTPQAKLIAQQNAAKLDADAAELTKGVAQWQQQRSDKAFEQKQQQIQTGIAAGHLALARSGQVEQIREFNLNRADKLTELQMAAGLQGTQARQALAKDQAERGAYDPATGEAILDSEGTKIAQQANDLEARAHKETDPAKAAQMVAQAKQLRADAEIDHGFKLPKDALEGEHSVKPALIANQQLLNVSEQIKQQLAADPGVTDLSKWAALKANWETAKVRFIEANHMKASSREMEAMDGLFDFNPDSQTARAKHEAGVKTAEASLGAITNDAKGATDSIMKGYGYKGPWTQRPNLGDALPNLGGKTSLEQSEAAHNPLGDSPLSFTSNDKRELAAENAAKPGEVTPTGLSKADNDVVQGLVRSYANQGDASREKTIDKLASYAQSDRPSVKTGILTLLYGEDPDVFKEVIKKLPADEQRKWSAFANVSALPSSPAQQTEIKASGEKVQGNVAPPYVPPLNNPLNPANWPKR